MNNQWSKREDDKGVMIKIEWEGVKMSSLSLITSTHLNGAKVSKNKIMTVISIQMKSS